MPVWLGVILIFVALVVGGVVGAYAFIMWMGSLEAFLMDAFERAFDADTRTFLERLADRLCGCRHARILDEEPGGRVTFLCEYDVVHELSREEWEAWYARASRGAEE